MFNFEEAAANLSLVFNLVFLSMLSEGLGVRPRLYFIPLWLLTISVSLVYMIMKQPNFLIIYVIVVVFSIGLSFGLLIFIDRKRFKRASYALQQYRLTKNVTYLQQAIYYPSFIYPSSAVLENNLGSFFEEMQRRWYFRPKQFRHYRTLLNALTDLAELNADNQYLLTIFKGETQNGVPKYLIDKMVVNAKV